MALRSRRPTGATSWPLILLAGEAKTGKTYAAAQFTGDERVGRCFWLDLGEGCADEYGAVPGADYEIIEHDGTWIDIISQVEEVRAIAAEALKQGEKPVVLVIDSMTAEWAMLSQWADKRARRSKNNKKLLAEDPDAEIDITSNFWNDATSRHNRLMNILKTFPGIVVMTALETEKTQFGPAGRPIQGAPKVAKPDAQKRLGADATVWIRLAQDHEPTVVGLRSVKYTIQPGKDKPRPIQDFSLGKLVFELMKLDASTQVRDIPELNADQRVPGEDPAADEEAAKRERAEAAHEVLQAAAQLGWSQDKLFETYTAEKNGADLRQVSDVTKLREYAADLRARAQQSEKPAEKPVRAVA
ncbi:AAA family ATPase [Amycolatopsis sp. NPDC006131]|uniref:AAA family ATPase n=1 Tax=Amycolatopsis sp. NPDC006131 TaxID=3156731 RepID=UPI0033A4ECBB